MICLTHFHSKQDLFFVFFLVGDTLNNQDIIWKSITFFIGFNFVE